MRTDDGTNLAHVQISQSWQPALQPGRERLGAARGCQVMHGDIDRCPTGSRYRQLF
jgi:hypothetical protein